MAGLLLEKKEFFGGKMVLKSLNEIPHSNRWGDVFCTFCFPYAPRTSQIKFLTKFKSRGTPMIMDYYILMATMQEKESGYPQLLLTSYLSQASLERLNQSGLSGIDLCGNGVINDKKTGLYLYQSGNPNRYPDSAPLKNAYSGMSSQVGRVLLEKKEWGSQKEIEQTIIASGGKISKAQVSKTVSVLEEDLVIAKSKGGITLIDARKLLEKLKSAWRPYQKGEPIYLKNDRGIPSNELIQQINSDIAWCISPESSLSYYTILGQGKTIQLLSDQVEIVIKRLDLKPALSPAFSDISIEYVNDPLAYFQRKYDSKGIIYSSIISTWLSASHGDARQQEAAEDLSRKILTNL